MKKPKLLLINPWIYDFAAYDFWIKPLGLLYIAAILRKLGYHIDFIDCLDRYHPDVLKLQHREKPKTKRYGCGPYFKQPLDKPDILKDIPRRYGRYGITEAILYDELNRIEQPDAVLLTSGMTYWYPGVFRIIEIIKRCLPDTPTILGGVYATLCYEHARTQSGADYVIRVGEEQKLIRILDEITGKNVPQLLNLDRLENYPFPAYDLIRKIDYICILTSRGCPFNCTFCAVNLLVPKFEQRSPYHVVEEIEFFYRKFHQRNFVFYDDALLINKENHLLVILEQLLSKKIKCYFHTPNGIHPQQIDLHTASLFYATGFKTIRLSFETSNPERQRQMYSKVTTSGLHNAIEYLKKVGYKSKELEAYVIIGLPGQPLDEMLDSILAVHRYGAKVRIAEFSPIPGTVEYTRSANYGFDTAGAPLLQNNTIFPLKSQTIKLHTVEKLKRLAEVCNYALERDLRIDYSSSFV